MTPSTLRTEALLAVAALLAGAAVGVLVQAAAEVGRGRRADREQLQAAAAVLDDHDAELHHARGQLERAGDTIASLREQLYDAQLAAACADEGARWHARNLQARTESAVRALDGAQLAGLNLTPELATRLAEIRRTLAGRDSVQTPSDYDRLGLRERDDQAADVEPEPGEPEAA